MAITPGWTDRDLRPWLLALSNAGLKTVLIREAHLDAAGLAALCRFATDHLPAVWVHDRNPHARSLGLPLHLAANTPLGAWTGPWSRSCHHPDTCHQAVQSGATHTFLSPIWCPTSKPDDRRSTLGLAALQQAPASTYALGGLTPARWRQLRDSGRHRAAVLGGLFNQSTPDKAAAQFQAFEEATA